MGEVAGFGERAAEFLAEKKNRGEGLQLAGSQSTSLKGNCSAGFGERAAEFLAEKKNRGEGLQLAGSQSTSLKGNCSGLVLSEGQRFSEGRQSLNGRFWREGCRVSGREEEQRRGIAACWKPINIAQGELLSSHLSPSGNLPSFPFPSLLLSLSFLPFPHHHRHHCQRPTAAAAFHLWLLVPPVAAGERRQQQWVIGSGGGGDLEREGKRKKEGGEREREGGCRAEGTVSGHALGMALTVVMSRKRRKKRGIERNREKRERGEIAGRRELRRRGDSRFWLVGEAGG
ncbi:hypothetical protein CK203_033038 [Vitis vinifera]|uniref:Uncharacterized protein n=1 Tax=Vitis vinifera TaxID=29760 RepID=A0A438HVN2_VITVI|nr:hypothetical protein CK203_033038 [Vitis vinifera]